MSFARVPRARSCPEVRAGRGVEPGLEGGARQYTPPQTPVKRGNQVKSRFPRRALLVFLAAIALPVAAPALASAAITPSLSLVPSTVTAGASQALGFDFGFAPSAGDSPSNVAVTLPAGLLPNATINGGTCLGDASPTAGCEVGTGTATLAGVPTAVSLWLVKAPSSADLAGAALVDGTTPAAAISTAAVTLTNAQVTLTFTNLPNLALSALDLTLSNLRAPTSCPTTPATVNVSANSAMSTTVESTSAPLTVTGCSSLAFAPKLAATATKDTNDDFVQVVTATSQGAGQAADKTLSLTVPAAVSPNATNAVNALNSHSSVGSAQAQSPLIPGTLTGNVTLTGTPIAPFLTITFPAPFPIVLQGTVSLTSSSVTFSDVPDVPLTNLVVTLNGGSNALYQTTCNPSSGTLAGAFTRLERPDGDVERCDLGQGMRGRADGQSPRRFRRRARRPREEQGEVLLHGQRGQGRQADQDDRDQLAALALAGREGELRLVLHEAADAAPETAGD